MGKPTPLHLDHALQLGVEVTTMAANGSTTCWCLFCVHESRDAVGIVQNGLKRRRTDNINMLTAPLFPQEHRSHMASQHADSWALYQEMSNADKKQYLMRDVKPADTLRRHDQCRPVLA